MVAANSRPLGQGWGYHITERVTCECMPSHVLMPRPPVQGCTGSRLPGASLALHHPDVGYPTPCRAAQERVAALRVQLHRFTAFLCLPDPASPLVCPTPCPAAQERVAALRAQVRLFSSRDHIRALQAGDVWAVVGSSQDLVLVGGVAGTCVWCLGEQGVVVCGLVGSGGGLFSAPGAGGEPHSGKRS